jgi:hypothetical protein
MPIYTNKPIAEKYWEENLRFEEFRGIKRENKIMREEIQDAIRNGVLVEILKHLIYWCNQYRLVPKANGDMISSRYEERSTNLWFRSTSKWKELLPYKISFGRMISRFHLSSKKHTTIFQSI